MAICKLLWFVSTAIIIIIIILPKALPSNSVLTLLLLFLHVIKHWAIDKGHKRIARELIESGAALDIQDKIGHSALHRASALNQKEVLLLCTCGNVVFLTLEPYQTVELLLKSSSNPNLQNQNGWTALHAACYYAHEDIVKALLQCTRTDINIPNKDGWTPRKKSKC